MGTFKIVLLVLSVCLSALNANGSLLAEDLRQLAKANNNLALPICEKLSRGTSENVFYSPLSLSIAFGMLYYGSRGETAKELRKALGYEAAGIADDAVHKFFHEYVTQSTNQDDANYDLHLANAIFVDKNIRMASDYKNNVQNLYRAEVREVDFAKEGKKIVEEVNELVRSATHEKIDGILDDVSPQSVMIVLNAVYFKGLWKTFFNKQRTIARNFYNRGLESEARKIPMMHMMSDFPYNADDDCQALELPYKGGNISMLILLPKKRDGLVALESKLTVEKMHAIRQQLRITQVMVALPKFKVEYSKEVSNAFYERGATKVFSPSADLSGISESSGAYVSEVLHKAMFEVNEEGSEAAAVTAAVFLKSYSPDLDHPMFTVNHPFLFTIVDNRNEMILFMGRINAL